MVAASGAAKGDVSESAAVGPVALAGLAEMAGLGLVVVIVVAEFGVGGGAAGALEGLRRRSGIAGNVFVAESHM